jgi:hypothetical protein
MPELLSVHLFRQVVLVLILSTAARLFMLVSVDTLRPASSHTAQALWKRSRYGVRRWDTAMRTPERLRVSAS